ncbi:MAG: hypothetical protein WC254_04450, partial [Candidatus Woesearchaeota archaeon]
RVYYYHVRIVDGIIEHNNSEISLRDYFPYIIRDEDTYDISNGQFPLAIILRIGEQYTATEFVKGSVLDGKSQLFDVTSLEPIQKNCISITDCEHGSVQYAMAQAFGKGSFFCTDTFILLASQQWEVEAKMVFDQKFSVDPIFKEYLNKGGKAYLCLHLNGVIQSIYSVFF